MKVRTLAIAQALLRATNSWMPPGVTQKPNNNKKQTKRKTQLKIKESKKEKKHALLLKERMGEYGRVGRVIL